MKQIALLLSILAATAAVSCREGRKGGESAHAHPHEHTPPHGGTPVVLGEEAYHLELVRDAVRGTLQAYVLDGHMESFVRVTNVSFTVRARLGERTELLVFRAVASTATGETVGDTSQFEARADWLKSVDAFAAVLEGLTVRGRKFDPVSFNFPGGNEPAAKP